MPPYYSTTMTLKEFYPERSLPLLPVYEALLIDGFKYGFKYGKDPLTETEDGGDYCDDLNSIARWNQELLDKNFQLGWTQHYREGYQQFLLLNSFYEHCRVITSSQYIRIIVPENEIILPCFQRYEGIESLNLEQIYPLKRLALSIWRTGLVTSIQTSPENGGLTTYRDLLAGNLPFICPFAVLDEICTQQFNSHQAIVKQEIGVGILLESQEAIYGQYSTN
jgi:hypothetical protein